MANVIKPKRSNTASAVPTTGQLASGELAVNMADQKVYINNGTSVVQVGAGNLTGLGDVNITSVSNNQVLKYDSATSKWINGTGGGGSGDVVGPVSSTDNAITRFDGTTGTLIQNSTVTINDDGTFANVNGITFDTTPTNAPTATGSMFWDAGDGTPSVVLNANTSLQLGQENVALVYNGTGSQINKGQVVAVSGAQGQRPSVVLADADSEPYSAATLGIAAENIANGAEGFICTFGLVRGIDTSGFTAGNPIWLSSTAGAFTATKPTSPAHLVFLGWVLKVNASSGEVFVHISNGWELDELHNVLITSPVNGNTLIYDQTAGVWKNAGITAGTAISVSNGAGSVTIDNTGVTSVAGTANQITASASTGSVTLSLPATISTTTGNFNIVEINAPTTDITLTNATGITSWVYSGKSISVTAQETVPTGLFFKPNGLKMYICGSTGDDVNEYTLSTAWDISTATFTNVSTGITQDTSPQDLFFKDDGLTLFVLGATNDTVYQYTLSVAWDITTATYASKSFSVATQDATPTGMWFKSDGTTMYIVGTTNDTVYQYTLSTPWDISTASYASISFSVVAQDSSPQQVVLSADGTKMWILGNIGDDINEYTLGTAWNIGTATFVNNVYVGFQETNPVGLFIDSTAANRVYIVGSTNDTVYQYNTATNTVDVTTDRLFVSGEGYVDGNFVAGSNANIDGNITASSAVFGTTSVSGTLTATSTLSLGGSTTTSGNFGNSITTGNISMGTGQTTGTFTIGGTATTGAITVGQSTGAQTLNLGTGATTSGTTKAVNIGTNGVAGSTTNISIGSTAGTSTTTINGQFASSNVSITGGSISGITDLAIADGGTGASTQQAAINALSGAVTSGQYLRGNGTNVVMSAIQAGDVPTLNQNTTGTASNVTGTVAIANGGTGATDAATALTNLGAYPSSNPSGYTSNTGTVTSVSGTGSYGGLTLTGTVTSSGSLTLGGTPTGTWPISVTGNSGTVTDGVYLSGTQTITGIKYFQSNLGSTSGSLSSPPLQVYASGSNSAFMSFHRGGSYAVNMGLDSDNVLRIGGWSASANRWQLDMSGNQTLAGSMTIGGGFTIDTPGSGYGRFNNWVNLNGFFGFYSGNNGAHFYVNSGTYGSWRVIGSRNGWAGLEFDPPSGGSTTLMMNRDTFGFHMNDTGWRFYNSGGSGYFPGNVVAYWSDQRLKENLRPIGSESLDIVSKINAYRFNWNEKVKEFNIPIEPGKEEIGLIAQEVQQVLPDAVVINQSAGKALPGGNKEKTDYLTINYDRITPILLQAINELRNRVEELENKIKSMNV